jgi:two-component system sensor histidine kinase KdpD
MSDPAVDREPGRPTAEEMLTRLRDEEVAMAPSTSPGAGRLRIFLGAAPGVGKTYEMLVEAREARQAGRDVVIGFVETYGRPQTAAQIDALEIVPRRRITYHGVTLEEMHTAAVIARHPRIALVDELAHTNAPGSDHEKRYEDVLDLLHAGIDVWTTMNVQHIESLHTTVETITGVTVRETVPDWIVDQADEVSLVDISVEEMHRRMREGKIYPAAQARMALENFFRKGNLTALRELALRRTAENVDTTLERYMTEHQIDPPWTATERIMVAVDHHPFGKDLVRRGWHLARGLKAALLVVYVRSPARPLSPEEAAGLAQTLELGEDLGADVLTVDGDDVAATLARLAQERNVTQIVLGHTPRSPWREVWQPSVPRRLLRLVTQDVHLISPPRQRSNGPAHRDPGRAG